MSKRPQPNRSYPSAFDTSVDPLVLQERLDRHYELCSSCKFDSTRCLNDPQECTDFEEIGKPKTERFWLIVAIIFVLIIIWFLLQRTNAVQSGTADGGSGAQMSKTVTTMDKAVYPGTVALWLEPGADVNEVLSSVGLAGAEKMFEAEDKFVVEVPVGDESRLVLKLKAAEGVEDAGFVYQD